MNIPRGSALYAGVAEENRESVLQLSDAIVNELGSDVARGIESRTAVHMTLAVLFEKKAKQQHLLESGYFSSLVDSQHGFGSEIVEGRREG